MQNAFFTCPIDLFSYIGIVLEKIFSLFNLIQKALFLRFRLLAALAIVPRVECVIYSFTKVPLVPPNNEKHDFLLI